ncbi:MAG: hypothetical protein ACRYFK_07655 [Janthinobacterium lividum]
MKRLILLVLAVGLLAQCHHADPGPTSPEDQLPPATQTGAHTLGCLINDQPWTPSKIILTNTLVVTYDSGYLGGALQVKAKRYTGSNSSTLQALTFGAAHVDKVGTYSFPINGDNGVFYTDTGINSCNEYGIPKTTTYQSGSLVITKFDLTQGIIAGTFNFKLAQLGCDTLRITQGRFDYTL